MAGHQIYPHEGPERLAEGVWRVKGGLPFPMYRNMIVLRLPDGELLLHSVVAMDEAGMAALEALGKPAYLIVPSVGHQMDTAFYRDRFPGIQVLAAAALREAVRGGITASVEEVLPRLGFILHPTPGTKAPEIVYEWMLPSGGRMLMVNDLFGGPDAYDTRRFTARLMQRLLGTPGNRFGLARIARMASVNDAGAVARFAHDLAETPDLKLITVSHGEPVRSDCAAALRGITA